MKKLLILLLLSISFLACEKNEDIKPDPEILYGNKLVYLEDGELYKCDNFRYLLDNQERLFHEAERAREYFFSIRCDIDHFYFCSYEELEEELITKGTILKAYCGLVYKVCDKFKGHITYEKERNLMLEAESYIEPMTKSMLDAKIKLESEK